MISLFIKALIEGRAPAIHGDGKQTRDFTYVSDVVQGVLLACQAENVSGEVINVANGGRISLLELVRALQISLPGRSAGLRRAARRRCPGFAG